MTYCPTPRAACSATRSSMKRARATIAARKGRVNGLMSGRLRHPSSGAASFKPTSSSSTCGGESTSACSARHKATRTAVLSGAATLRLVQGHGGPNESLQSRLVQLVAFVEVDGAPDLAFETGIEEARRVLHRGSLGEGHL